MKITVSKNDALSAMSRVAGIVERSSIPVLRCVNIHAENNWVTLTTTDMDMTASVTFEAEVSENGSTCVPADTFLDICKKAGEEIQITLEKNSRVKIKTNKSTYTLNGLSGEDFPKMTAPEVTPIEISQHQLADIIQTVSHAISKEETRYYLCGVYFENKEGKLAAVSTDGHRLATYQTDIDYTFPSVILPSKLINFLAKNSNDPVYFAVNEKQAVFELGNVTIISKLVDGTYPNYERIIPKNSEKSFNVSCAAFLEVLEAATVLKDNNSKAVKITLEEGFIKSLARSSAEDHAESIVACEHPEYFQFGINYQYLLDTLKSCNSDNICVNYADAASPLKITVDKNERKLFVIMPMRV